MGSISRKIRFISSCAMFTAEGRRRDERERGNPERPVQRSDSYPKPAGANPYGRAGLLTRPVRGAFPVNPVAKSACGPSPPAAGAGTYSSEYCSGFSPDSLFIRTVHGGPKRAAVRKPCVRKGR